MILFVHQEMKTPVGCSELSAGWEDSLPGVGPFKGHMVLGSLDAAESKAFNILASSGW